MANGNTLLSPATKDLRFAQAINKAICDNVLAWAHVYGHGAGQRLSDTAAELGMLESCDDGSVDASDSLCDLL